MGQMRAAVEQSRRYVLSLLI